MIDPAALGTLTIGLDRIQRENASTHETIGPRILRPARAQRDRGLTRLAAAALRRFAEALAPAGAYDPESASL